MPRGILPEVKLQAVKDYVSGNGSYLSHASKLGVNETVFTRWVNKYKAFGESAFIRTGHDQSYSASLKKCIVEAYLNGEGSYRELAVTYHIPSENTIRQWVLKYNGREKLKKTSEQFGISYQQARNYTIKYEKQGVEALRDRRGRRKPEEEMSELEKLRAENRILRAEKEHAQMEADFLKKLAEIERRRG